MLVRLAAYAALGLLLECAFTGARALLRGDRAATCTTYLVVAPLWALGGLALESFPWWWARITMIYALEAAWGLGLIRLTGACPWRYSGQWAFCSGTVSLALLPAWTLLAIASPHVAALLAAGGFGG